ncbi:class I SAM-dependent methyltransferase [Neisseria leonii]|uniref:Class I SAM-dependent methyltransferase n=1 Tax=Neisseria leonii TaxID=2995413 RepID=A0A9X4E2D2_9NEIS|nr:class I SAM-dependent methyltransferase [Neisseria sp. 51.81]MDD9327435.1 class I SAM-dependent methyltransferase [Neisseria sp. 51.81]
MSNWNEGYTSDITYTYGYYPELSPQSLTVPFLNAGIAPPKITRACELGFGQGVSVNIHAAAGGAQWYGTDFNPAQVQFARHLGAQGGTEEKLHIADQSFAEFCARDDLPEFDFIGLHGIWSWISDENRRIIADFLRRKLKVGGVLYISYNTLPGWSANAPLRHLLAEYDRHASAADSRQSSIVQAVDRTREALKLSHRLTEQVPGIAARADSLAEANVNYLAHEYLNGDWHPMYYTQIESSLQAAKLTYVCSASYLDDYDDCLFDEAQKAHMAGIHSSSLRQTTKDFFLNRQFRRDYWVKGGRQLTAGETAAAWNAQTVMLAGEPGEQIGTVSHYRTIHILEALLQPLLEQLKDRQPHKVADLAASLKDKMNPEQLYGLISLLEAKKNLVLVQSEEEIKAAAKYCRPLNRHILERARDNGDIGWLASPATGSGVAVGRIDQLFLLAHTEKVKQDKWPQFVWEILKAQNLSLIRDGQTLSGDEANLAELVRLKTIFVEKQLPLMQKLQVV